MRTRTRRFARPVAIALLVLVFGPRCQCEEDLSELKARVQVTPEQIDFGQRPVGATSEATFRVGNVGNGPAHLAYEIGPLGDEEQAEIEGELLDATGLVFSVTEAPDEVGAQRSLDGKIAFTPATQGRFGGALIVRSDDPEEPVLRVPLFGEGGPPLIEASPSPLDFGTVNEGPGAARVVRVRNTGFDFLHITDVRIVEEGSDGGTGLGVFQLGPSAPTQGILGLSEALAIEVQVRPTEAAVLAAGGPSLSARLVIESDAKNAPILEVPLVATANLAPRAVAVELITRRSEVRVGIGREVTIDGNDTEDPEGDPFTFTWTLAEAPAGSEAFLVGGLAGGPCLSDAECEVDDGYRCTGSESLRCRQVARTRVTPDVVGTYVVRLRATDSRGAYRDAEARILPRDLAVVLRWEAAPDAACQQYSEEECAAMSVEERRLSCCGQSDVDLHLIRPGGTLGDYGTCPAECVVTEETGAGPAPTVNRCYEDQDAYAATCRQHGSDCAYANRYPEWGSPGRADDPRLDVDDVRGEGPEVISLNEPLDGIYTVVVHYCSDRIGEPSLATVDVYVKGALRHTAGPQRLEAEGLAWIAATLTRTGGPQEGTWTFSSIPNLFDDTVPPDLCQQ